MHMVRYKTFIKKQDCGVYTILTFPPSNINWTTIKSLCSTLSYFLISLLLHFHFFFFALTRYLKLSILVKVRICIHLWWCFYHLTWHRYLFGDFTTVLTVYLQFEIQKNIKMATVQFEWCKTWHLWWGFWRVEYRIQDHLIQFSIIKSWRKSLS